MSGFAARSGYEDGEPLLPPLALADMIAGMQGAAGTLTALRVAERTGRGQVVDLSLFEPIFSTIASQATKYMATGELTSRTGNESSHTAPRNLYRCSDGKFVSMSGSMQVMAMRIFDTIGRPELKTDPKFADNDARVQNRAELDGIIGSFIGQRTQDENLAIFEAAQVTVGPVLTVADLLDHPYSTGREVIVTLPDDALGRVAMHNISPRLDQTPGRFRRPAPRLGEHTQEVLDELRDRPSE